MPLLPTKRTAEWVCDVSVTEQILWLRKNSIRNALEPMCFLLFNCYLDVCVVCLCVDIHSRYTHTHIWEEEMLCGRCCSKTTRNQLWKYRTTNCPPCCLPSVYECNIAGVFWVHNNRKSEFDSLLLLRKQPPTKIFRHHIAWCWFWHWNMSHWSMSNYRSLLQKSFKCLLYTLTFF